MTVFGRQRRRSLHFIRPRRPLPERASWYFPPSAARRMIAAMDDNSRNTLLADLASARDYLFKLHADAVRKRILPGRPL